MPKLLLCLTHIAGRFGLVCSCLSAQIPKLEVSDGVNQLMKSFLVPNRLGLTLGHLRCGDGLLSCLVETVTQGVLAEWLALLIAYQCQTANPVRFLTFHDALDHCLEFAS